MQCSLAAGIDLSYRQIYWFALHPALLMSISSYCVQTKVSGGWVLAKSSRMLQGPPDTLRLGLMLHPCILCPAICSGKKFWYPCIAIRCEPVLVWHIVAPRRPACQRASSRWISASAASVYCLTTGGVWVTSKFLQGQETAHILVAELLAAMMMAWMAIEAVYHENAFELLASASVALAVAARIVYFLVSPSCLQSCVSISCVSFVIAAVPLEESWSEHQQNYSKVWSSTSFWQKMLFRPTGMAEIQ